MDDRHCDMCRYFEMIEISDEDEFCDTETGNCTRYHEIHYPTDGRGCPGWEYWEEAYDTR